MTIIVCKKEKQDSETGVLLYYQLTKPIFLLTFDIVRLA